MLKTYTILEFECKQISVSKGALKYLLVDELGQKRQVSAIANLGIKNQIKSLYPIQFREQPLIEALSKAKLNDTVNVDFSHFNEQNPRNSSDKNRAAEEKQLHSIINSQTHSIPSLLFFDRMRVFQLLGLVVLMIGFFLIIK